MQSLIAYLKQLSMQPPPGITNDNIRIATVITPDVDPVRRKTMINMVQTILRQKNSSTVTAKQGRARHHMVSAAEMIMGTEHSWTLDIWELQGKPETWSQQLISLYKQHPVFALVSGLSNSTWQPIHDFCDTNQVPCWFPSVNLPAAMPSPYAFYFSGGVVLEADVLGKYLLQQPSPPSHIIQIYQDDVVGQSASAALTHALAGSSISVTNHALSADLANLDIVRKTINSTAKDDAVMFWLSPTDIKSLSRLKPPAGKSYFSGALAGAESAPLDSAWRRHASMVYLYEMPDQRFKNMEYFHIWLNIRKIPLVDEAMQSEVFFAFNFFTDTISEMLNNLYRDYLVERAETMLSRRETAKAEQETRDRLALGRTGELSARRGQFTMDEASRIKILNHSETDVKSEGTTIYPHLSLGPEQRFASKSGYIVQFSDEKGQKLTRQSELIVP
jgi:hypothetical protein